MLALTQFAHHCCHVVLLPSALARCLKPCPAFVQIIIRFTLAEIEQHYSKTHQAENATAWILAWRVL